MARLLGNETDTGVRPARKFWTENFGAKQEVAPHELPGRVLKCIWHRFQNTETHPASISEFVETHP